MAISGDIDELSRWLDSGGDIDIKDENGATPIMWAVYGAHHDLVEHLLDRGAETASRGVIWLDENQQSFAGNLMTIATSRADTAMLRLLVEKGGLEIDGREWDPTSNSHSGWRALQSAASNRYSEIVDLLLDLGAIPELENEGENAPLMMAAANDVELIARILVCYDVPRRAEAAELARAYGNNFTAAFIEDGQCDLEVIEQWLEAENWHLGALQGL